MHRKNLFELMAAAAAAAALGGCASAPTPQHTADVRQTAGSNELGVTRNAWAECVRAAIPRFDNPQSSSEAVARAAMKGCAGQYTNMVQAQMRTMAPTCARDAQCTRNALAKAQRDATQAATDEVVSARVRVAGAQVLKCQ